MHWHFLAALHGKGAVGGIRAIVKRVARKKSIISTAKDLATTTNNLKINVILLTEIEKLEINNSLGSNEFFEKTKKIKDLPKCHNFQILDGNISDEQLSPKIAQYKRT